jgi:hypothetical protein
MSKGLLAHWRRGILGRGITGALLLAVPVMTAAVIGFSGGFGSVAGGLSELTTGPDATFTAAPAPTTLNTAIVAAAGGGGTGGAPGGGNGGSGGGGGNTPGGSETPAGATGGGGGPIPNIPDVPNVPGGGNGGPAGVDVNGTVDQVVGGANDTVGGVLGGN